MSARRGLAVVLLLASSLASADVTFSGFLQQNTAFNTREANPDGRHHKWLEERAQLKLDAGDGAWHLLAKGDIAWDHLGRQDQSELRELYVDYTASNWDTRIGRQVVTWGLGDLLFVNDVWAKDHEALFSGRPLEYLKRGVDAIKIGAYPEFANFELIVSPTFRESRIPDARRFHLYDPMPAVTTRGTVKPGQGDVGLRIYRDVSGWDVALYSYRGFQRTPSMRPDSMTAPTRITYFYPQLSVLGASASGRIGKGVFSLEAARYGSREDRAGSDFAIPNSQTRILAGYQFQPLDDVSLSFQFYVERMHDYEAYRAALPAGFPIDKRWNQTVTARWTQQFLHQTLRFSTYVSYNDGNGDHFVNPELRYSFNDKIWGAVGANLYGGKPGGQFGQLERDDNVYLQVRYEF